jgi:hypothetical protein
LTILSVRGGGNMKMKINTAEDYKNSLKELSTEVYFMVERIDDIV